jgi:hypothetical protein
MISLASSEQRNLNERRKKRFSLVAATQIRQAKRPGSCESVLCD